MLYKWRGLLPSTLYKTFLMVRTLEKLCSHYLLRSSYFKRVLICFQVIWYMLSLQNGQWTNNQGQISECIAALENCHHYFFPYEPHVTVYWCDESPLLTMYYTYLQRIVDSCISKPFVDQPKLQINDLT